MRTNSKTLMASAILGLIYVLYLFLYFSGVIGTADEYGVLALGLASMIVTPHLVLMSVGTAFSIVATTTNKKWAGLTAYILFYVATAVFPYYIVFSLPIAVLGTVGWYYMDKK